MTSRQLWLLATLHAVLLWVSGPVLNAWPAVFFAVVPLLIIARQAGTLAWKRPVYVACLVYWLLTLQGLRHAHPLMFLPLFALAAYLAVYPVLFIGLMRYWSAKADHTTGLSKRVPVALLASVLWVGGEWVRNYFATGISVAMLGHALADMPGPYLIQIADLFGTYGVSFLIVVLNVAVGDIATRNWKASKFSMPAALLVTVAASWYGVQSLAMPTKTSDVNVLLVGRDEQTEYGQTLEREEEIFGAYARQTIAVIQKSKVPIDVVVWPESMLSGGMPWMEAGENARVTDDVRALAGDAEFTVDDLKVSLQSQAEQFTVNHRRWLSLCVGESQSEPPHVIGGCGIVRYNEQIEQNSGVLLIGPNGNLESTYAKNHLVMMGEYVPILKHIPVIRSLIPPGLGLQAGQGPAVFQVAGLRLLPNLCIETAVERIAVNHLHQIANEDAESIPDAIVTLTNDTWFDGSAVVAHHLRCAQLVAVGTRRAILSSANGGPTVWIDHKGSVVQKIDYREAGTIAANVEIPQQQSMSVYVRFGSLPAAVMGWVFVALLLVMGFHWKRGDSSVDSQSGDEPSQKG